MQVTVFGNVNWTESALITQPLEHQTVMPEHNRFGANWFDSLGNPHGYDFTLDSEYFFASGPLATRMGSIGIYGTFNQNPTLFTSEAPVELLLFGSGSVNPKDCTSPCRFQFFGGDELLSAFGRVTTTFTFTPFAPAPEPASGLLLLPALGMMLWRNSVDHEQRTAMTSAAGKQN